MILWRLSGRRFAAAFDGGYGLTNSGRWNRIGRPVTYAATSPSLCVLEKLVHVEDPDLLPDLAMVRYDVPDNLSTAAIMLEELPDDWRKQEGLTQSLGEDWLRLNASPMLRVPSAIVPIDGSPDMNIVFNHAHPDCVAIRIIAIEPFKLDPRLF